MNQDQTNADQESPLRTHIFLVREASIDTVENLKLFRPESKGRVARQRSQSGRLISRLSKQQAFNFAATKC